MRVPEGIGDSWVSLAKFGSYHESQACAACGAPVTGQAARVDAVPFPTDDGRMARRANRVLRPRQVHVPDVNVREPFKGYAVRRLRRAPAIRGMSQPMRGLSPNHQFLRGLASQTGFSIASPAYIGNNHAYKGNRYSPVKGGIASSRIKTVTILNNS